MEHIEGKVAFITGGGSGIGLGIAKACGKYGMKIVIADMRQDALDETTAYFKEKKQLVHAIKLDVTDRDAYVEAADEAESVFGNIHVLINNAGVGSRGGRPIPFEKLTYKDWDYSMSVNVGGVINGVMTILPRMLKHGEGGHIVTTSSTCGLMGSSTFTVYCTTKYAVIGMMECLATELQDKNIGVSAFIPGPTISNLARSSFENKPARFRVEGEVLAPLSTKEGRRLPFEALMDPLEAGERVIRGIRNNDLFIITHPEWKAGFDARHKAITRAIPDEPRNEKRWNLLMKLGDTIYNDIYDKQKQVGKPDR